MTLLLSAASVSVSVSVSVANAAVPAEIAFDRGTIETPRMVAMNGGLRASSQSLTALFTNPANLAAVPLYHVGAIVDIWPQADRQTYGGGIVDSLTSRWGLAMGFGGAYTRLDTRDYGGGTELSPEGYGLSDTDLRLGMAFPFSEKFRLGVTGRYLTLSQNGTGPLRASPVSGGLVDSDIVVDVTLAAGVTVQPTENFAISVVGDNLTNPGNGFMPLQVGGGLAFMTTDFVIEADMVADMTTYVDTTYRAIGGVEFLLGNYYPIRASYAWDGGPDTSSIAGGIGYSDRSFTLELGVRQIVDGPSSTTIGIGFTMLLEGSSAFKN